MRSARGILVGALLALICGLIGAALLVALQAAPRGPAFAWPLRLVGRANVLVMGLDRTVSDQNPKIVYPISRTDTLIAVTFDPAAHRVVALSIPRDTRVPIPGHGTDKINAAHAYGGGALSLRTVQNVLGVSLPYYIEINQRGFVHLIDAVGGVTVRIDKDLDYDDNWDGLHIHLKKGNRRLGGKSAMEFARFRHDALGDIGRIQRQQQVLNALLDELRRPRVVLRLDRILRVFREDMTTNLDPAQLVALGLFGARLPKDGLVRETYPGRFGSSDWVPDPPKDRDAVARFFYGIDPAVLARATVEVVAAGAGREITQDALARLQALGVRVVRVGAAPDAAQTALVSRSGDPRVAEIVAAALGVPWTAAQDPSGQGPDLTLVLGRDTAGTTLGPQPPFAEPRPSGAP